MAKDISRTRIRVIQIGLDVGIKNGDNLLARGSVDLSASHKKKIPSNVETGMRRASELSGYKRTNSSLYDRDNRLIGSLLWNLSGTYTGTPLPKDRTQFDNWLRGYKGPIDDFFRNYFEGLVEKDIASFALQCFAAHLDFVDVRPPVSLVLSDRVDFVARTSILTALTVYNGDVEKASDKLGISILTLERKMKRLGITDNQRISLPTGQSLDSLSNSVDKAERKAIEEALGRHKKNREAAASELGISVTVLWRKQGHLGVF